jgi:hypothetical protein
MSIKTRAAAVLCAAAVSYWAPSATLADQLTESSTLAPTTTNFNTDGSGVAPLSFQQFNTDNGTLKLDSVVLSVGATIQNNFGMTFTTPATITGTVSSSSSSTSTGPSITVFKPDGTTPLITAVSSKPNSESITYGSAAGQTTFPETFSSTNPKTSPNYVAPLVTTASNSLTLTSPADLALFTGSGTLKLPVSAQAFSHFVSTSGNGVYSVTTQGSANATVTYNFSTVPSAPQLPPPPPGTPTPSPEPTTVLLWGVAGAVAFGVQRSRRRA